MTGPGAQGVAPRHPGPALATSRNHTMRKVAVAADLYPVAIERPGDRRGREAKGIPARD